MSKNHHTTHPSPPTTQKNMPNIKKIAIISGLGLAAIAVMAYLNKQTTLLKNACYTIAGAIINEISLTRMIFTLILNISNKSDIDFVVTNQKYNIYVNEMLVAVIENKNDIKVNSNGMSTVNIEVSFNPQDLLQKGRQNIALLMQDKNNIIIDIKGFLSIQAGFINVKNYEIDERLSLQELLSPSKK